MKLGASLNMARNGVFVQIWWGFLRTGKRILKWFFAESGVSFRSLTWSPISASLSSLPFFFLCPVDGEGEHWTVERAVSDCLNGASHENWSPTHWNFLLSFFLFWKRASWWSRIGCSCRVHMGHCCASTQQLQGTTWWALNLTRERWWWSHLRDCWSPGTTFPSSHFPFISGSMIKLHAWQLGIGVCFHFPFVFQV